MRHLTGNHCIGFFSRVRRIQATWWESGNSAGDDRESTKPQPTIWQPGQVRRAVAKVPRKPDPDSWHIARTDEVRAYRPEEVRRRYRGNYPGMRRSQD